MKRDYDTLVDALADLKKRGYTQDFNIADGGLAAENIKLHPADFEITEYYRFEGMSDPGDSSIVYAIEGKGVKGILVNAYGIYHSTMPTDLANKLDISRHMHES